MPTRLLKLCASAVATLTLGLFGPAPAQAASGMRIAGVWEYPLPDDVHDGSNVPAGALIVNEQARRGYQLFKLKSPLRNRIRIVNLDSFEILAERDIELGKPIGGIGEHQLVESPYKGAYIHGLDPIGNKLYFPYETTGSPDAAGFVGIVVVSGETGETLKLLPRRGANRPTDLVRPGSGSIDNPGGFQDDPPGFCTSSSCQPQPFGVAPLIAGMDFTPSHVSGGKNKLIMLWYEPSAPQLNGNVFVVWATQWDAETGKQDFSYRIQSCNANFPPGGTSLLPLPIFQARLGAGIYVGCNTQGQLSQVVRIRLDGNGLPNGEDSYPGPRGVTDIFADREVDRILFRVNTGQESYWVFNGPTSNYTGISVATQGEVGTRTGLNPKSGRLYVMAPGAGGQPDGLLTTDIRRSPTPQMLLDPKPFVPDIDLSIVVDTGTKSGIPRLFVHPEGTTRFVIIEDPVPPSEDERPDDLDSKYTTDVAEEEGVTGANYGGTGHAYGVRTLLAGGVLGAVPIFVDAGGLTARNLLNVAGSDCMPPDREFALGHVAEAVLSNNRASAESAAAMADAGTKSDMREPYGRCYPNPRGVPDARKQFHDAAEERFGDESDLPLPDDARKQAYEATRDRFQRDSDGDGLSDYDEIAGSDWPFSSAVCSGTGEAEEVSNVKPLDRDPVPADGPFATGTPTPSGAPATVPATPADEALRHPRDTSVGSKDNRATVACAEEESFVTGDAITSAARIGALVPQVDSVEVGSVGAFTRVYRDEKLGLVSDTVAYARNIRIGTHVFMDLAYSRAIAWARGRPGTAGTYLERKICGVTIPAIAGQYSVIPIDTPQGPLPPGIDPIDVGGPFEDATRDVPNEDWRPGEDGGTGHTSPVGEIHSDFSEEDTGLTGSLAACGDVTNDAPLANTQQLGPRPFLEILNRILGSRGRATIPEPDTELRAGSPGGYIASIQKDRLEQIGARVVSNDGSTQVPALEIQFFQDDVQLGRGRQLFQFAGVDASVTYGIYLLEPEFDPPAPPIVDPGPPPPMPDDSWMDNPGVPGIEPYFPEPRPPIQPPTTGGSGFFAVVTYPYRGVSFLTRSWQDAALAGAVFILLGGPLMLLARRRALRTLP